MSLPSRVPMARELKQLRAKLTREEHIEKAELMAKELGVYDAEVLRNKVAKATMRQSELEQASLVRRISTDVRLGSEVRDVACQWVADFPRRVVELIRTDTSEVIDSRSMTDSDRQMAIEYRLTNPDEISSIDANFRRPNRISRVMSTRVTNP